MMKSELSAFAAHKDEVTAGYVAAASTDEASFQVKRLDLVVAYFINFSKVSKIEQRRADGSSTVASSPPPHGIYR